MTIDIIIFWRSHVLQPLHTFTSSINLLYTLLICISSWTWTLQLFILVLLPFLIFSRALLIIFIPMSSLLVQSIANPSSCLTNSTIQPWAYLKGLHSLLYPFLSSQKSHPCCQQSAQIFSLRIHVSDSSVKIGSVDSTLHTSKLSYFHYFPSWYYFLYHVVKLPFFHIFYPTSSCV